MGQPRVFFVIPLQKGWEAIFIGNISVVNENQKLGLDTHNQAATNKKQHWVLTSTVKQSL